MRSEEDFLQELDKSNWNFDIGVYDDENEPFVAPKYTPNLAFIQAVDEKFRRVFWLVSTLPLFL